MQIYLLIKKCVECVIYLTAKGPKTVLLELLTLTVPKSLFKHIVESFIYNIFQWALFIFNTMHDNLFKQS